MTQPRDAIKSLRQSVEAQQAQAEAAQELSRQIQAEREAVAEDESDEEPES